MTKNFRRNIEKVFCYCRDLKMSWLEHFPKRNKQGVWNKPPSKVCYYRLLQATTLRKKCQQMYHQVSFGELQLKSQRPGNKTMYGCSVILILKSIMTFQSPWILLNKNINFKKHEMESKIENPTHSFREVNLALQLI